MATYNSLPEPVWKERLREHVQRLSPYATERVQRMNAGQKHPVRDFLFEYFSYRPAQLLRWSPGFDCLLENAQPSDLTWGEHFTLEANGLVLNASTFPRHRSSFVFWAREYLQKIALRPAFSGCFGLHEWAMVYREAEVRHSRTPLRLSADGIANVVESNDLCCTHYDAFRFFTPNAKPRNRHELTRQTTDQFDQPGCVHVTMDLYKFAYKLSPWVPGELLADAFMLAWDARELDMKASPYDLREFGFEPIRIEESTGRQEYVRGQQELAQRATPIRERLIRVYESLADRLNARS